MANIQGCLWISRIGTIHDYIVWTGRFRLKGMSMAILDSYAGQAGQAQASDMQAYVISIYH